MFRLSQFLAQARGDNPQICGWLFGKLLSTLNGWVTGLWWHLVSGGAAWTWSANQRPVSGASDQSETGAVGSAQFICVMILKQNLWVRALLSLCHPGLTVCKSEMAEQRISKLSYHKAAERVWGLRLMLSLTFEILALPLEFQTSPVWQIYPAPRDAYLEELCVLVLRILQIDNIHLAAGPGCSG